MGFLYVTFFDCAFRSGWVRPAHNSLAPKPSFDKMISNSQEAELWLMRTDNMRMGWIFRMNAEVRIHGNTISFREDDVVDEIAFDEDKIGQKPGRKSVVFKL